MRTFLKFEINYCFVKKIVKIPEYSEEEIKEIEKEFDKEDGWTDADKIFGKDRKVESYFISLVKKSKDK